MLPTITVDIGTTSVKLSLFDETGAVTATARHATPTQRDHWGEVYDVPALRAMIDGFVRALEPEHRGGIERIAITGVGESGGLVRGDLSLASPMILWHDHRGAGVLERLSDGERTRISRITGLPVNANYGLSKIVWSLAQTGGAAADAQWLNIAEYLAALLTGERWSEFSLASRTMVLDLAAGRWSDEVCAMVGITTSVLPELRPATHGAALLATEAARLQLPAAVRVHVAGHDHMVGAIGAALEPDEMLNSTGTTEGILFTRTSPLLDDHAERAKLASGVSSGGDTFTLFASIPTGGSAFATLQSLTGRDAAELTAIIHAVHTRYVAGEIDDGEVPLILPRFRGAPPPTKDAAARGIIAGLGATTRTEDIVFGTFVGMALQMRDVLELFPQRAARVKVIGPASRNPLWLQLKADLLGTPLSVSRFPEVVSRGAQALASGTRVAWTASEPREIAADPARHTRLTEWAEARRTQWEYLKSFPS